MPTNQHHLKNILGKLFDAMVKMASNETKSMKKLEGLIKDVDSDLKNILDSLDRIYKTDKEIMTTTVNNIGEEIKVIKNRLMQCYQAPVDFERYPLPIFKKKIPKKKFRKKSCF